jgi:hypothetical protein
MNIQADKCDRPLGYSTKAIATIMHGVGWVECNVGASLPSGITKR